MTIDLPYERWSDIRGVSLGGLAAKLSEPGQIPRVGRLFVAKFPAPRGGFGLGDQGNGALLHYAAGDFPADYGKGVGHVDQVEAGELET